MNPPTRCLSEYRMDRYLLGIETDAEQKRRLHHLERCSACAQKLARYQEESQRYAPPSRLASSIHDALGRERPSPPPWFSSWFVWLSGVAVAGVLLMWSGVSLWQRSDGFLPKGRPIPKLILAVKRAGQIRLARSGELFFAKDQIRIAYRWDIKRRGFLFVVHRTQHRKVSPLFPASERSYSLRVLPRRRVSLPDSFELDGQRDNEEIWACFSDRKLGFRQVQKALPSAGSARWSARPRGDCEYLLLFLLRRE